MSVRFSERQPDALKSTAEWLSIEPANICWGRFIYTHFHHEGFDPNTGWEFESEFPLLQIIKIRYHTPFRYLSSGGLTLRQFVPAWSYPVFKGLELRLSPLNRLLGMFQTIILEKKQ